MDENVLALRNDKMEYLNYSDTTFSFGDWIDDYRLFPEHGLPLHWHESFEFITVISGSVNYYVNGKEYSLQTGDALFVNSNKVHYAEAFSEDNTLVYGMVFLPDALGLYSETARYTKYILPVLHADIPAVKFSSASSSYKEVSRAISEIKKLDPRDYFYQFRVMSLLNIIWLHVFSSIFSSPDKINESNNGRSSQNEEIIRKILLHIKDHYSEPLTISDLISIGCINRTDFFKYFKLMTNMTPSEYLIDYRLRKAAILLHSTDLNITDISLACGFCSSSYLGLLFKRKYGISPYQYRKERK